jgi:hypothetical protein
MAADLQVAVGLRQQRALVVRVGGRDQGFEDGQDAILQAS